MADRIIRNAESTDYPVWIVGNLSRGVLTYIAGPWFSRKAAEEWLEDARHNHRKAVVYCASGHESDDYRHLCETGRLREASNG